MSVQHSDLYSAARLIQWALRPDANPTQNDEYRELIDRYLDRLDFREAVQVIAKGLGLTILEDVKSNYSVVLAPAGGSTEGSAFSVRPAEYRTSARYREDDRLLDGLIHVAISATVYPRAADLRTDAGVSRNPVTVDEVEVTLRQIVDRFDEASRGQPDPVVQGAEGIYEAWRVYKYRLAERPTKDNRAAPWTTRRMIEFALDYLCKQRCFRKVGERYQPLRRYQVLVQEYAASRVHETIQRVLAPEEEVS